MKNRSNKKEIEEDALINIFYLQIYCKELVDNSIHEYLTIEKVDFQKFYDEWRSRMVNIINNYENKKNNENIHKLSIVKNYLHLKETDTLDEELILKIISQNLSENIDLLNNYTNVGNFLSLKIAYNMLDSFKYLNIILKEKTTKYKNMIEDDLIEIDEYCAKINKLEAKLKDTIDINDNEGNNKILNLEINNNKINASDKNIDFKSLNLENIGTFYSDLHNLNTIILSNECFNQILFDDYSNKIENIKKINDELDIKLYKSNIELDLLKLENTFLENKSMNISSLYFDLKNKYYILSSEYTSLKKQLDELNSGNLKLKDKIEQKKEKISVINQNQKYSEPHTKIVILKNENSDLNDKIEKLMFENIELKKKVEVSISENLSLKKKIKLIFAENLKQKEEISKLNSQLIKSEITIEKKNSEIINLKLRIEEIKIESEKEI